MFGKKLAKLNLCLLLVLCLAQVSHGYAQVDQRVPELAIPTGGNVVAGTAKIDSQIGLLNVKQDSQQAIVEWQSFNIGAQAKVNFEQPGSDSVILNRVLDSHASQIYGQMSANGQVFLTNPHGVLFAEGASLDVGALVATTHRTNNKNFLNGTYLFEQVQSGGRIDNAGSIAAKEGGFIALLGSEVLNRGVVSAQLGSIVLGTGEKLLLSSDDDGFFDVVVDEAAMRKLFDDGHAVVTAQGEVLMSAVSATNMRDATINTAGLESASVIVEQQGRVFLTDSRLISQEGMLTATSGEIAMSGDAVYLGVGETNAQDGGEIVIASSHLLEGVADHTLNVGGERAGKISLDGGKQGSLILSSTLTADNADGAGGEISVTASEAGLLGAQVSADGSVQGGTINIGGQWQGGGTLRHAEKLFVNDVASLSAQSSQGNGGSIAIWSSEYTGFLGEANTDGALVGGQIEVSSKGDLRFDGGLHAGDGGKVLFDPTNITIGPGSDSALTWRREESAFTLGITTIGGDENDLGQSLAIEGGLLAIGLHSQDNNRGAVYLYTGADSANFSGLVLEKKLGHVTGAVGMPSIPTGEFFGEAVSIDNGRLAVGAPQRSSNVGRGAVYLFDGIGADFSTLNYVRTVSSGAGATSMPTLDNIEYFGASLDLDGDLLVVGAYNDNTGGSSRGEVFLFSGMNSASFSSLAYQNSITSGATGVAAGMPTLADNDAFGRSISIDGGLLAVGAIGDDTGGTDRGAVHLFSGFSTANGSDYSGLTWQGKITSGSSGVATGMPSIEDNDEFGYAVDLNGGRLAVGAPGSDFGNTQAGSLYVFSGTGSDFSALKFDSRVRSADGATSQPVLTTNEAVGRAVALDADKLILGGQNSVHFFDVGILTPSPVGDAVFATNPASDNTITAASITALLDAGTAVTLQANNDILVSEDVIANNPSGAGGHLTLQAGRSVTVAADVTTDDGDFTVIANAPASSGVVDAYRSPGAADIDIQSGANLAIGAGTLTLEIQDGAGNTNNTSGNLTLRDAIANSIVAINNPSNTTGELHLFGVVSATGVGNALIAAAGQVHLDPLITLSTLAGRWLMYSETPVDDTIDVIASGNSAIWGRSYASYLPGAVIETGNRHIFATTGSVTLTTNNASKTYGSNASLSGTYSGLPFDGSLYGNAYNDSLVTDIFSSAPTFSSAGSVAAASVTGGPYSIVATPGTLNSGFSASYVNSGMLTVNPAALTISAATDSRDYDGTLTSAALPIVSGLVNSDTVTGLAQVFDSANVGARTLSVSGYTVNDGSAGANYSVTTQTAVGTINPLTLTLSGSVASDKIYDGNAVTTVTPGTLTGLIGSQTLNISNVSGSFADKHAGANRSVTVSYTLADGSNGGLAANYSLGNEILTASITPAALNLTTTGGEVRTYDGTINSSLLPTTVGLIPGDTISTLTQTYANANVGVQNLQIAPGYVINDGNGGNNYAVTVVVNTGQVTPALLTYVNPSVADKVYDGTTTGVFSFDSVSGLVGSETPGGVATATFASSNVASNVGISFQANLADGANGFLASNYTAAGVSLAADILPAMLTISGVAETKIYDGGINGFGVPTVSGLVAGDTVSGLSQRFDSANVGVRSTLVNGYMITDGNMGNNYTVVLQDGVGQIDPASLVVGGSVAVDKVYDGTPVAAINLGTLTGLVGSETLGLSYGAVFNDKHAGAALDVTASYVLSDGTNGGLASNYVISNNGELLTASITPADLVLTAVNDSRIYDATNSSAAAVTVTGLVGTDTISGLVQVFDAKHAGTRTTEVASYTIGDGNGGANYSVTRVDGTGSITPAPLLLRAISDAKDYDGALTSSVLPTAEGLLGGDTVADFTQVFDARDVGPRSLGVDTYRVEDDNGGNNYQLTFATAIGQINPIPLIVTARSDTKTQDGLAYAGGSGVDIGGFVGVEDINVLAGALSYTGDSQGAIIEGAYDIVPGGLTSTNYIIEFVSGELNILPAPLLSGEPQPLPPRPVREHGIKQAKEIETISPIDLRRACSAGASLAQANICGGVQTAGSE